MSDNIPNLETLKFEREPGFLSLFDPERFKAFGLTPLAELKARYQTPQQVNARADDLKNDLDKATKNILIVKAEMGGLLMVAGQSALPGGKIGLAERTLGLNKNTGYLYVDLYKFFVWGYDAARDAAIAEAEKNGTDPSEVSIRSIIDHGKAEALKAGAVETITFTGSDVLIIDSSLPSDERIKMSVIPPTLANRKGSKAGYWVNVDSAPVPLRPEYVWMEMNVPAVPYFTFGDVGYETRLMIARIDQKAKKIYPDRPQIEEIGPRVNFKARKPQTVSLPLCVPSTKRVIWDDHSDAALDSAVYEVRELGDPVAGVIAFQPKGAEHNGFFDIGGQQLHGSWTLASLGDEGILIRPAIVNYSLIQSEYAKWTSADLLAAAQKNPPPDNGERWDVLDAESIKSEFGMGESPLLTKLRMADLIDGWQANDPTDKAADEGYARHKNKEVEWNIAKIHQELVRLDGFAPIAFTAAWKSDYLRSIGLLTDDNKATQKAVDDGLALTVAKEFFHADWIAELYETDEAKAFIAEWSRAKTAEAEQSAARASRLETNPIPDGAMYIHFDRDEDSQDLRRLLILLGYIDEDDDPTDEAIEERLAVQYDDGYVWFSELVENRIKQPDADATNEYTFVDLGSWLPVLMSVGLSDDEGRGTEQAAADGLVFRAGTSYWHGTKLRDRMGELAAGHTPSVKPADGGTATGTTEGAAASKTPATGQENGEEDLAEPVQVVPFKIKTTEADAPDSPAKIAENLVASLGRIESLAIQLRTLAPSARTTAVITGKIEAHAKDAAEMFKQLLTHLGVSIEDEHTEQRSV